MSKHLKYFPPADGTGIDQLSHKDDPGFYSPSGLVVPIEKSTYKEVEEENQIHFFTPGHEKPFMILNCKEKKLYVHYKKKIENFLNGDKQGVFVLNDCSPGYEEDE